MTQLDIFSHFMGEQVYLNKGAYRNPFRPDNKGTCLFTQKGTWVRFYDPADPKFNGMTCYEFVFYEKYNRRIQTQEEFRHAIELSKSRGLHATNFKPPPKRKCIIEFKPREFTQADVDYWGERGISTEDLKADETYSVKQFAYEVTGKPRREITPRGLCFAYTRNGRTRIYQPFSKYKWMSNFRKEDIYYWPGEGPNLVWGSYKDGRVAASLGFHSTALAYENCVPKGVNGIIVTDFDEAGNKFKRSLVNKDVRIFNTDLWIKDLDEIRVHYGESFTKKFIKRLWKKV